MKKKLYTYSFMAASLCFYSGKSFSQANTSLSNLASPTSVNQDLTPNTTNSKSLGSLTKSWRKMYLDSAIYLGGNKFISYGTNATLGVTAVGNSVLVSNSGYANTGIGFYALNANTSGNSNAAIGTRSLQSNKTGNGNMAMGYFSLSSNTTGHSNVAIGVRALNNNTAGSNLVAIGDSALYNQGTAVYYVNTAIGSKALYNNKTGYSNSATGYQALTANVSGNYNTATGGYSLPASTTGSGNTATGLSSLSLNTTGSANTAMGILALQTNETGNYNTMIGAYSDINADGLSNATALGYYAIATASDQVMLGNTSVTSVKAAGSVILYSDGRYKKDLKENVPGLEFIKQLRPVTYHYDIHGMNDRMGITQLRRQADNINRDKNPGNDIKNNRQAQQEETAIEAKEKKLYSGFVAQEVEATAKKLKYDFSGVYAPQNDKDLYGLSYSEFVVPLVKAVQELNDSLKIQNEKLQLQIDELKAMMLQLTEKKVEGTATLNTSSLSQNKPNPFKGTTVISYNVPARAKSARLIVYDAAGKPIKQVNIAAQGKGSLRLDTTSLASGAYNYSLVVDGKVIDTKKMLLID